MGKVPLRVRPGGLYSLVTDKEILVADSYDFGRSVWDPRFRRNLFEMGDLCRLLFVYLSLGQTLISLTS